MDKIDEIKELIAAGDTEQALQKLVQYTKENRSMKESEALLLMGQFNQWKRDNMLGIQQSNSELRRIEVSVMDLLEDHARPVPPVPAPPVAAPRSSQATNYSAPPPPAPAGKFPMKAVLIGAGVLVVLIILIASLNGNSDTPVEETVDSTMVEETNAPLTETEATDAATTTPASTAQEDAATTPVVESTAPADAASVNGENLKKLAYGSGDTPKGYFQMIDDQKWVEQNLNGEVTFNFKETGRDESSVYLRDDVRGVSIQLNVSTNKVMYRADSDGKEVVLTSIIASYAE